MFKRFRKSSKKSSKHKRSKKSTELPPTWEQLPSISKNAAASLKAALTELDERPITTTEVGIYRISGRVTDQRRLLGHMLAGRASKFTEIQWKEYQSHCISGAVKYLLGEFSPLTTYGATDSFIDARNDSHRLNQCVEKLPTLQKTCMYDLLKHLVRIAFHHSKTKMSVENLAIVFTPQLFREDENPASGLRRLKEKTATTVSLINLFTSNGVVSKKSSTTATKSKSKSKRATPQMSDDDDDDDNDTNDTNNTNDTNDNPIVPKRKGTATTSKRNDTNDTNDTNDNPVVPKRKGTAATSKRATPQMSDSDDDNDTNATHENTNTNTNPSSTTLKRRMSPQMPESDSDEDDTAPLPNTSKQNSNTTTKNNSTETIGTIPATSFSATVPPTGPPPPTGVQALIGLNNKDNKDPASSPQKKVATRRASPQIIDSDSEDRDDNNDNNTNIENNENNAATIDVPSSPSVNVSTRRASPQIIHSDSEEEDDNAPSPTVPQRTRALPQPISSSIVLETPTSPSMPSVPRRSKRATDAAAAAAAVTAAAAAVAVARTLEHRREEAQRISALKLAKQQEESRKVIQAEREKAADRLAVFKKQEAEQKQREMRAMVARRAARARETKKQAAELERVRQLQQEADEEAQEMKEEAEAQMKAKAMRTARATALRLKKEREELNALARSNRKKEQLLKEEAERIQRVAEEHQRNEENIQKERVAHRKLKNEERKRKENAMRKMHEEEQKEKARNELLQVLSQAPPPTTIESVSSISAVATKNPQKTLSHMPSFLNAFAATDGKSNTDTDQLDSKQQPALSHMPSFLMGFTENVPPPPQYSDSEEDVSNSDDEEVEVVEVVRVVAGNNNVLEPPLSFNNDNSNNDSKTNTSNVVPSYSNNSDEWGTKELAIAQLELRNAQLKKLQDVQTIEYLKAQNAMLTTIAAQREGVIGVDSKNSSSKYSSFAININTPQKRKEQQQQQQQQAPSSPQQERSRRSRRDGLLEYPPIRKGPTYMSTLPQDVTFHTTEEMLLRSRKRIQQELTLSRLRTADVLGGKSRHLEQRMMDAHANSSKRYSELHGLYAEAVNLRDRYDLSVQVQRPVMTSNVQFQQQKNRLNIATTPVELSSDLAAASDQELEKYRTWLRGKSEMSFGKRNSAGPVIY